MEEAINHLIIINGVFINIEQSPCLIELNLCSYDITKKRFSAESTYFITPSIQITPELMEEIASKTMESDMKKFIPIDTALSNLDSFISPNFVSKQIFMVLSRRTNIEFSSLKRKATVNGFQYL